MDKGSLDLRIASVIFFGVSDSEVTSAKHVALQEPVPTTPKAISSVEHEIYYRPADHDCAMFKKMETNHHKEIIAFSIVSEESQSEVEPKHSSQDSQDSQTSPSPKVNKKQTTSAKSVDAHKSEEHEKQTALEKSVDFCQHHFVKDLWIFANHTLYKFCDFCQTHSAQVLWIFANLTL